MSVRRITTALSMTGREFLRRRGMIALMVGVPVFGFVVIFLALPQQPAALDAIENDVVVRVALTQPELFGGLSALAYVGLLSGVTGLYLLRSAMAADRRLMVAGYSPLELMSARILLLVLINLVLSLFLVGLMLFFLMPRQLPAFVLAVFWAAVIYSFYGGLIGVLVRNELGGIIAVLFLANIDVGYLEIPGYSTVLEEWWAVLLPGYFPTQLAIDAGFTSRPEKLAQSFWSVPHALVVAGFMMLAYQRATHVHEFLPERRGGRAWRIGLAALVLAGSAGGFWYGRSYFEAQPRTVQADGRVAAPAVRLISPVTGRVRDLRVAQGDRVESDAILALMEDQVSQATVTLRAPGPGTVTTLDVREGEIVVAGAVMAQIHRLDRLEVVLEVEETSVAQVVVGQRVELKFAALGESIEAVVTEIAQEPLPPDPGVTESAKRVRKYGVKVPLPRPDERLRLGMAVKGRVFL